MNLATGVLQDPYIKKRQLAQCDMNVPFEGRTKSIAYVFCAYLLFVCVREYVCMFSFSCPFDDNISGT